MKDIFPTKNTVDTLEDEIQLVEKLNPSVTQGFRKKR